MGEAERREAVGILAVHIHPRIRERTQASSRILAGVIPTTTSQDETTYGPNLLWLGTIYAFEAKLEAYMR